MKPLILPTKLYIKFASIVAIHMKPQKSQIKLNTLENEQGTCHPTCRHSCWKMNMPPYL